MINHARRGFERPCQCLRIGNAAKGCIENIVPTIGDEGIAAGTAQPHFAGEEEVEYFVDALDDVLTAASRGSGLFWEVGRTMAKGALRRSPG